MGTKLLLHACCPFLKSSFQPARRQQKRNRKSRRNLLPLRAHSQSGSRGRTTPPRAKLCRPTAPLPSLTFSLGTSSAIELMSAAERADLELLLSLDTADEELYEQLAAEFPEEDGDAT